ISAANAIYAEGQTVSFDGTIAATNAITLVSTDFDVILGKTATTKTLIVEADRNLQAVAGSLRGSELVQVRANDIVRNDTTVTNRKLGVIAGTLKDVVVELRTGTFGTLTTADNSGYELAAITASGSVSLNALAGNMYLRGTINAARDIVLESKGELFLRSATLTAARTLHLESESRVKPQGGVVLNPGTTLEIVQGSGWFYTSEWLTTASIGFNLVAFANRIVVDSDHRFVNRDVTLRATEDIRQRDHVISARNVAYSAGNDILLEFDGFDWRSDNPGATNSTDWWNVPNAGLRGHAVLSQNALTLYAGNDIHLISGKLQAGTDLELTAGRNILSEPFYLENYEDSRPINIGWGFSSLYRGVLPGHSANNVQLTELRAYENIMTAGRDLNITAGGNIDLIGTGLTASSGDVSIHSHAGTIVLAAAPGFWLYNHQTSTTRRSWFGLKKTTTTVTYDAYEDLYKPTTITAANGDVSIVSAAARSGSLSTIISAGSVISAQNLRISTRNAANATTTGGSISLGTYAEVSRTSTRSQSKSSFIGITYRNRTNSSARTATFNSGNDLLADDILTIASGNNLTINAGTISARVVNISAVGNINILAAINSDRLERYSQSQNLVTITTIQEGYDRETAALPQITSPNPVNFTIGGSAHIAAAPALSLNAQLLTVIGTRQFDLNLNPLHTTAARNAAATAATQVSSRYTRNFTLPGSTDGAQFRYLDTLVGEFGATYNQIVLRDQTWYDKQVQLTPAFQALLTVAVATATGGAGLGLSGVQAAVANSLISGGIRAGITGNFDAGSLLRDAVLAGATSFISTAINTRFELGTSLGLSDASPFASGLGAQFAPVAIVNRLGAQIVNNTVSNVLTGRPVFEGLDNLGRTFLVTETLGVVQFGIGGLGSGNQNWEGSLPHILLHGGAGCIALLALDGTCGSGFFAGASQGILAGSQLSNAQKEALAPFVGGFAGFLFAEGEAIGVTFGATVASSGLSNNYLTHAQIDALYARVVACNFDRNCIEAAYDLYRTYAQQNRTAMEACTTAACWEYHAGRMRDAQTAKADVYAASYGSGNFYLGELSDFVFDQQSQSGFALLIEPAAVQILSTWGAANCGGVINNACRQAFVRDSSVQTMLSLLSAGIDFVPIVGDVKGILECAANVTVANCVGAAVSLIPVLGDGARVIIRHGGNTLEVVSDGSGSVRVLDTVPETDVIPAVNIGGVNCVYTCVINGQTVYVGRTNDITRRGNEHLLEKGISITGIRGLTNLSLADARAIEQALIHTYGLGRNEGQLFMNRINSISPTRNPTFYETEVARGLQLLEGVGYQWTF
ncbi:MAG: GIY-YIG nuclease family protein, partial [Jannaschia sp.]